MVTRPLRAVFIEPKPPTPHIFSLYSLPRLGCVLLATLLRDRGWEATVFVEEVSDIDFDEVLKADLVGISTITSTTPRSYALAEEIRQSGVPVVLGGPHVTFLPEEALEHADMVVRGEGEIPIIALAEYLEGRRDRGTVPGLSYRENGRVVHNPEPGKRVAVETIPAPDLSLIHGYVDGVSLSSRVVPIQATRGCPFQCTFCSVTSMFGRPLRRRPAAGIVAELARYRDRRILAFFYDDNFTADPRYAREVCEGILAEGLDLHWSAQSRLEVARDPELLDLMFRAGCRTLFIGFESVNPEALAQEKKSQSAGDMATSVRAIRKAGIEVHGMFIFGFDADAIGDMEATLRFSRRVPITTAQFLILTPFPGTDQYERFQKQGRLLSTDWNLYDGHHVVFQPRRAQPLELQQEQVRAHWRFYSWPRSLASLVKLKLTRAAIYFYARRNNSGWKRRNRPYLAALTASATGGGLASLTPRGFPDIHLAAARARDKLVPDSRF